MMRKGSRPRDNRPMPDALSIASIASALGPLAVRFDVDVLPECTSTNTVLLERAGQGAPAGTVVVAERQTAGRGRLGRAWISAAGDSLTFSLLWRLPAGRAPSGLSLAVGVGIAEALRGLGVEGIALKWPNDILLDGRKLGGILVEMTSSSIAIGVGLNLRLPADLPDDVRATAAALGTEIEANLLLGRLLAALHHVLEEFGAHGFAALRDRWQALNAHAGVPVRLLAGVAEAQEGVCAGIDVDGALLLETAVGLRRIVSGDVSLRTV